MKAAGLFLAASCLLFCSCKGGSSGPVQDGGRAVQIVLEDVTVRQYRHRELRFSFQARKLVLDEEAEVLEASAGIQGRIEAGAFPHKEEEK